MSPYKDLEKEKEAGKERIRRYREKQKALQSEGVTGEGVTEGEKRLSKFPNQIVTEKTVIRDGMPRYVTLSDGQVMDREYKPEIKPLPGWMIQSIKAINIAGFKPNAGNIGKLKTRYDIREI